MKASEIWGNTIVDCITVTNGTASMSEDLWNRTQAQLTEAHAEIERLQQEVKDLESRIEEDHYG